jgi:ribosomal peptide maturation radical SAM protein 1
MVDVLLVSMPFGDAFSPSIGLSLLQPQVRRRGLTCDIVYLTIPFAELIGQDLYCSMASNRRGSLGDFVGEWIFSDALFDRGAEAERDYVQSILIDGQAWPDRTVAPLSDARIAAILRAKRRVPEFLDASVARVTAAAPRIVGFTSVFQQHVASLALARRVKACLPETVIVFGGANCESVMGAETLRQFAFIDAVVSGEGDLVFPDLATRVMEGRSWADLPGVLARQTVRRAFAFGRFPQAPVVEDLDALPYPDYTDYFTQFNRTRLAREWQPSIFVETSRGCWWGERMHCTFCGLNGSTMTFRSKTADRAYTELAHLAAAYPECDIQVVDNILDLKYFNTLLPALAAKKLKISLFYETKSNLKKEQVRLLRDAGVRSIQPGIESFSDQVLKLMKKGVSGLQNIQLLKWCKQFGVEPHWNLLFGFPGESPDEYHRMAEMVPHLAHLPGPLGAAEIRLDRFSPNYADARRLGFANVRPLAPYRFIYDFPDEALGNLAYYFAYDYQQPTDVASYVRRLLPRARVWRRAWRRFELLAIDEAGLLTLLDTRPAARAPLTVLGGLDRDIYLACDEIKDIETLARTVASGGATDHDDLAARLAAMVGRRIMVRDGSRYLSLAVPLGDYAPSGRGAARVLGMLSSIGRRVNGSVRVRLDQAAYQLGSPLPRRAVAVPAAVRSRARGAAAVRLTRSDFRIIGRRELQVRAKLSAR